MKFQKEQTRFKRVFKYYRYIESDAFAQYLHEMSLKGWHLKEWKFWLEFEKGECQDIEYAVEVFPKGSEMDVKPGMDAEEYAEYCRAAGWELVDGRRRFCIFRKISESALPIVTEEERFSNICRAEWRWCLLSLPTTGVVYGISAVRFTGSDFVIMFFSNAILFTLLALALLPVYEVLQCISLAVWQVKAWRKIRRGERPVYGKRREMYALGVIIILMLAGLTSVWGSEGTAGSAVVLWIWIGIITAVLAGLWFYRPSRRENWVLQIAAGLGIGIILFGGWSASLIGGSMDREEMLSATQKLPLVLTDYSRTDEEITFSYYKERSSILGTMLSGTIEYGYPPEEGGTVGEEQERLSYTVYRSDVPWLLEQVWREEIKSGNYQEYDWMTKAEVGYERWGAKEVMRRNWEDNSLYVRYENAILTLYTTKPPEGEQIDIIREKLEL
ncbi:MAG: DUF2812 domain-containing protein [Lachnospiraceae bacterium]|nr:DUF2812 domain-containing protein [Lachnospiraceae bacterium]